MQPEEIQNQDEDQIVESVSPLADVAEDPTTQPTSSDSADLTDADAEEDSADLEAQLPVVNWQASEYIHHDKSFGWYAALVGTVIVLSLIAALAKQWPGIAVFIIMAVAIIIYGRRPPRTLNYALDEEGVRIGDKLYPYGQFSSFGVLQDAEWQTIDLEPIQRFMPRLSLLFEPTDLDAIIARLVAELPRVDRSPDVVERITHAMRF